MTRAQAAQRGDRELTIADLDSMKYLVAVMKVHVYYYYYYYLLFFLLPFLSLTFVTPQETLRYHPILSGVTRIAGHDDDIPLGVPQKTRSGEIINSVPVSKGQRVYLSFAGYNR